MDDYQWISMSFLVLITVCSFFKIIWCEYLGGVFFCWLGVPCFKYRPSRPRYQSISRFLPATDTDMGKSFAHIVRSKKQPIFEISADKSPDMSLRKMPDMDLF